MILDNIFFAALAVAGLLILFALVVTMIADARHPDQWKKEKVASDRYPCGWEIVDVGSASETHKEDWVLAVKGFIWASLIVAAVVGLLWLGMFIH